MNIRKMISVALGLIGSVLCLSQAQAQAPTLTTLGSAVFVTSVSSNNVTALDNNNVPVFNANLYSAVYRETSGNLTFVYQFKVNSGPDAVETFSANNFKGFTVSEFEDHAAGDQKFTGPFSYIGAGNAFVNPSGSTIDYTYTPAGVVVPNANYLVVVRTNAQFFAPGTMSLQDGGNVTVAAFQPSLAPEPGSVAAFAFTGLGTMGLMLRARKGRRNMAV